MVHVGVADIDKLAAPPDETQADDDLPYISRTQRKNRDRGLQQLGEQLIGLSREQLRNLALPEELLAAVHTAQGAMPHVARRRQLQYIGVLMRGIDAQPIREALESLRRGERLGEVARKTLERWRDELQAGNLALVEEIMRVCPTADRQRLGQLARNAARDQGSPRAGRSDKALLRYLQQIG